MDKQIPDVYFPGMDESDNSIPDVYFPGMKAPTQQAPPDLTDAATLGNNPNSSKYNGWCLQFVDDVLQTPPQDRAPSAFDSWNKYSQQGKAFQGTQGIEPGDVLYLYDPNDPNGHVGFYSGKNSFISATEEDPDKPVQNHDLSEWQKKTGQQILGYVKNPQSLPSIQGGYYGSN